MTDSHIVSYTCPRCRTVSYNPNDARERYCGACHRFEEDSVPPLPWPAAGPEWAETMRLPREYVERRDTDA